MFYVQLVSLGGILGPLKPVFTLFCSSGRHMFKAKVQKSKNIVMAQGVYCYIEGLNFVNFGPIHGFYNHYLVLEDNTRGLGAEIRFLMGSKTFFLQILAWFCDDGSKVRPLAMVFVCIMLLGLTRRDINLFFSFSDFETRTRINPDIFQTKRLLRKILSFFVCVFFSS